MDLIFLNLRPRPEPEGQAEAKVDAPPDQETGSSFTKGLLELCNPFEALEWVPEDPRAALVLVVLFGVVVLAALILCGLWSAVQESLSSGGPPPGLGLR
ncbi:MAG TPA: hypothetical protein VF532_17665 [Candidatus Angelobacter sp.]